MKRDMKRDMKRPSPENMRDLFMFDAFGESMEGMGRDFPLTGLMALEERHWLDTRSLSEGASGPFIRIRELTEASQDVIGFAESSPMDPRCR